MNRLDPDGKDWGFVNEYDWNPWDDNPNEDVDWGDTVLRNGTKVGHGMVIMSSNDPYQSFATSGSPRPIDDVIHTKVTSRKNELMEMEPVELRNLPECTSESFEANGKRFELTIWHEEIGSAEQLFVIQCKRTIFLAIGNMHVEGFVLGPKGEIRDAEENLLWDFS